MSKKRGKNNTAYTVENGEIDDCLMFTLDIALRNLALVDFRFFRQIIYGVGFLQRVIDFVLIVWNYLLDRRGVTLWLVYR